MRVRVPPAMLQDAGVSPFRRKIISLEQPYAGSPSSPTKRVANGCSQSA